jgi:hypothetical protein
VDERLTDDLLRIEVCQLAHAGPEFADRSGEWTAARAVLVRSDEYLEAMGIPAAEAEEWPWGALREGMAFISGAFELVEEESAPLYFRIAPQQRAFVRIDHLDPLRDSLKEIYSQLLTGAPNDYSD